MRPPRPWTVTPHDPIEKLDGDLWAVDVLVPRTRRGRRRMVMARRTDGAIVFFIAVPLADDALDEVRAWGTPGWLVVPNLWHRTDAHVFRERLGVRLLCDAAADAAERAMAPVDGHVEDLPPDPVVSLAPLGGTTTGEVALIVARDARVTVAFADAFMNMAGGTAGLLMDVLRFTGGPRCPPLFRRLWVRDRRALAGALESLAALPGLSRLVPTHGAIVDADAAGVLRRVIARALA